MWLHCILEKSNQANYTNACAIKIIRFRIQSIIQHIEESNLTKLAFYEQDYSIKIK